MNKQWKSILVIYFFCSVLQHVALAPSPFLLLFRLIVHLICCRIWLVLGPGKTKWLANNAAVCSNKDRKLAETLSKSVWVSTLPYPRNTCSAFSHLMQPRGSMWQFVWWRLPPVARTEQRRLNLMSPHKFTTGISWIIIFFAVWPWDAPLEKFGFSVLLDGSYIKANY